MKIVFFEAEEEEKNFFKRNLKDHDLVFIDEPLNKDIEKDIGNRKLNDVKDADIISVFIYSKINKKVLGNFKNLKAIVTRSTGFDHIDAGECKKKKISIFNVPLYGAHTVAEHTFALVLSLSRRIVESSNRTRKGNFSLEGLSGVDLKGKTLGIIGVGSIGSNVAKIAKSFGMNVLVYDIKKNILLSKKIGFNYVDLESLLKNSDFVSIHLVYNKKTYHLLNKKRINLMKKGAFLINTSRGGIVDTKELVRALDEGRLRGAGIDVLEEEYLIKEEAQLLSKNFPREKLSNLLENHMLLKFDNVIITPHNAFNSKESIKRIMETTLESINCIANKRKCKNKVKVKG